MLNAHPHRNPPETPSSACAPSEPVPVEVGDDPGPLHLVVHAVKDVPMDPGAGLSHHRLQSGRIAK